MERQIARNNLKVAFLVGAAVVMFTVFCCRYYPGF